MVVLGILHTQVVSTTVSNVDGISLRSGRQRLENKRKCSCRAARRSRQQGNKSLIFNRVCGIFLIRKSRRKKSKSQQQRNHLNSSIEDLVNETTQEKRNGIRKRVRKKPSSENVKQVPKRK